MKNKLKRILAAVMCLATLLPCVNLGVFAAGEGLSIIDAVSEYHICGEQLASDGYIGIPVEINTYYDSGNTNGDVILYVINTNTERVGTDSDEDILKDLISRGFIVLVVDYKNNPRAKTPELDWSTLKIAQDANMYGKYLDGAAHTKDCVYVLPSGYNIERNIPYWDIEEHGTEGSVQHIINVWNTDFLAAWGNTKINVDGVQMTVREYTEALPGGKVTDISQCLKKDGTRIDTWLYLDILYPTNPENEVPVMMRASSSETRGWTGDDRPHMNGYVFNGYAGVIYDHCYTPMAGDDHYGYFNGTSYDTPFSIYKYTGVKSETAVPRRIRYLVDQEPDKYKFDLDKFGGYGHSKSSHVYLLANEHPENLAEMAYFADNPTGAAPEGSVQPWLTYKDGSTIPSNIQMVYTSNGGGADTYITDKMAPTFVSSGEDDGDGVAAFVTRVVKTSRQNGTPCMYYTMPGKGHTIIQGYSEKYQVNMYQALFDFTHYYLKNANAICEHILPLNGTKGVDVNERLEIKFTGPVSRSEVESKIVVRNKKTGEIAHGTWTSDLGDTTWYFVGHDLKGGYEYEIIVPKNVIAENGKTLREGKRVTFKTKSEQMESADEISGSMTVTNTNGAYFVFDSKDYQSSTTVSLRFSVTNDAANNILVYSVDSTSATSGELIGKVAITGAGDFNIDVTDYVKSLGESEQAIFMLKAEKAAGETTVVSYDFENGAPAQFDSNGITSNKASGGSYSFSFSKMKKRYVLIPGGITEADLGRKFIITYDLYAETNQLITAGIANYSTVASKYADWNDETFTLIHPISGQWQTVTFEYHINDADYCKAEISKDGLYIEQAGYTQGVSTTMYMDNLVIKEIVTDVVIADTASSDNYAPTIVLHKADENNASSSDSAYVESGDSASLTFDNESGLFVSGNMAGAILGENKKVYAKLDLENYAEGTSASIGINVTDGSYGKILIYGLKNGTWNKDSINYYNAPANDRLGAGIDLKQAYGGAPIGAINVMGSGEYSVDITDYAMSMKALGKTEATLIIVSDTEAHKDKPFATYDFDSGEAGLTVTQSGGVLTRGVTSEENYPSGEGYSYKLATSNVYGRLKFDILNKATLTTADIGRRFTVSYYLKADYAGSFLNILVNEDTNRDEAKQVRQTYTTANVWQQFTYDIIITEDMITDGMSVKDIPTLLLFELDRIGSGNATAYIDNIVITELAKGEVSFTFAEAEVVGGNAGHKYSIGDWTGSVDVDGGKVNNITPHGFSWKTKLMVDEALDHGAVGSDGTSIKLVNDGSNFRLYFHNTFANNKLTAAEIGNVYDISIWIYCTKSGSIDVGIANDDFKVAKWISTQKITVSASEVNTWKRIDYTVTITEDMFTWDYNSDGTAEDISAMNLFFGMHFHGLGSGELYVDDFEAFLGYEYSIGDWTGSVDVDGNKVSNIAVQGFSWKTLLSVDSTNDKGVYGSDGTSLKINSNGDNYRIYFYNTFIDNKVSATDIGDVYDISIWVYCSKAGSLTIGTAYSGMAAANWINSQEISIAEGDLNKWKEIKYTITVNETMVNTNSGVFYFSINFNGIKDKTNGTYIYIDDFKSEKKPDALYVYRNDLEDGVNAYFVGGMGDSQNGVSADANHTDKDGASKSIWVSSENSYERIFLKNLFTGDISTAVGKTFTVSFWAKSSSTGTLRANIAVDEGSYYNSSQAEAQAYRKDSYAEYVISDSEWHKYTYEITITQEMVDAGAESLGIYFSGLKQNADSPAVVYIDDILSIEKSDEKSIIGVTEAITVSNKKLDTDTLSVSKNTEYAGIKNTYIKYDCSQYTEPQKAVLKLNVLSANGQTLKIYGLVGVTYPSSLTYLNAPALKSDGTVDLTKAYGGAPIATVKVEGAGVYDVDVTNYIKDMALVETIFLITTDDVGGSVCIDLDFEKYTFTEGVDFNGSALIENGEAAVSGSEIEILNVFGGVDVSLKAGVNYKFSAYITSAVAAEFGFKLGENVVGKTSVTAGVKTKIEFNYTATATDEANGISSVKVFAASAVSGFKLDGFKVTNDNAVKLSKTENIYIETAVKVCEHSTTGDTDNVCGVCGLNRPLADVKIEKSAISLYYDISIGFRVSKASVENFSDLYLMVKFGAKEYLISAEESEDGLYWQFVSERILPNLIDCSLYYTLHAKNSSGEDIYGLTYETSIMEYCYKLLGHAGVTDADKNLIADTLNYAAAAQMWANGLTEDLVNKGLSDYPEYGTMSEPEINDTNIEHMIKEGYEKNITSISVSLKNGIRLRITNPTGYKLVVKSGGKVIDTIEKFDADGSSYVACFNKTSAAQLRKLYTFELTDSDGNVVEAISNYSFESYAYTKLNTAETPENLKKLVKAMMTYGDSALSYIS